MPKPDILVNSSTCQLVHSSTRPLVHLKKTDKDMAQLSTPLSISKGTLSNADNIKESLNLSIELLLNTPLGSVPSDPEYGFVFTGLKFEIFEENNGTIHTESNDKSPIYKKKISGSSKNIQTFASELNEAIRQYEPRLRDTATVMTYIREKKEILVAVRGVILSTLEQYEYKTVIKVW